MFMVFLRIARNYHRGAKRGRVDAWRYKASTRAQPSGARETKRAGVLYSTPSPLSEPSAVDSGPPHIALAKWGRCAPAAVGW